MTPAGQPAGRQLSAERPPTASRSACSRSPTRRSPVSRSRPRTPRRDSSPTAEPRRADRRATSSCPASPPIAEITDGDGTAAVRADHHLPGRRHDERRPVRRAGPLGGAGQRSPGRASRALADFDHPGVDRVLQWDLQHADRTIDLLTHYVVRHRRGARLVEAAAAAAWRTVTDLGGRPAASGDPRRHHRRQRGVLRRRRPPARRHHRLRRPDPVVGRRRTGGDGVVGAAPRRRRTGGDAARSSRRSTASGRCSPPRSPRCGRWWCCAPPRWWSAATSRPPSMPTTITPQALWSWSGGSSSGPSSVPAEVMTGVDRRRARRRARRPPPPPSGRRCYSAVSTPVPCAGWTSPRESDALDAGAWLEPTARSDLAGRAH